MTMRKMSAAEKLEEWAVNVTIEKIMDGLCLPIFQFLALETYVRENVKHGNVDSDCVAMMRSYAIDTLKAKCDLACRDSSKS